jgi:hypothetical protein
MTEGLPHPWQTLDTFPEGEELVWLASPYLADRLVVGYASDCLHWGMTLADGSRIAAWCPFVDDEPMPTHPFTDWGDT